MLSKIFATKREGDNKMTKEEFKRNKELAEKSIAEAFELYEKAATLRRNLMAHYEILEHDSNIEMVFTKTQAAVGSATDALGVIDAVIHNFNSQQQ